ncbi:hypothetical protein KUW09_02585 [Mameliella alba]|nr:hypothetical protein [Antarctobacter heliothermus]MBY6142909.1 hypothetical protein [Mameliella alba]MCA0953366.1 DUF6455 family protein [Mameliella alba]
MAGQRPADPRPRILGDETEHYWLVQRMAKATGVDLVGAMDAKEMSHEDWSAIVTRCRACQWAEGCAQWLDQPADQTRALPDGCHNRKHLSALKEALTGTVPQEARHGTDAW